MGRQTLFDVSDNIAESNDCSNAQGHRSPFPEELKASPYLSSPIRPIPTIKYPKRSKTSTERIKDERGTVARLANGPPRNKSLECDSSETLQSLRYHANGHTASKTKAQSRQLCILLPDEIDDLAKLFGTRTVPRGDMNHFSKDRELGEEKVYESSDEDSTSTLNSDFAASLEDDRVLKEVADRFDDNMDLNISCASLKSERKCTNLSNAKHDEHAKNGNETVL